MSNISQIPQPELLQNKMQRAFPKLTYHIKDDLNH